MTRFIQSIFRAFVALSLLAGCGGGDAEAKPVLRGARSVGPDLALWSETSTWGGSVPGNGATVTIGAGQTIYLDTTTANLASLTIENGGKLIVQDGGTRAITSDTITITGTGSELVAGTAGDSFGSPFTITLTGAHSTANFVDRPSDGGFDTTATVRGLIVQGGGKLNLLGTPPSSVRTYITDHIANGATTFKVANATGWAAGDTIVLGPTDWYGVSTGAGSAQQLTLASTPTFNGTDWDVTVNEAIVGARWGRIQYVRDAAYGTNGMSLTNDGFVKPHVNTPTTVDQRATVLHLTRNIKFQGANDTDWSTNRFGAHLMVMDLASEAKVNGVEFLRVGQGSAIARYPMHWHMLSYSGSSTLGNADPTKHYLTNSAIWNSSNRCITIHGTNAVKVTDNNCFDIKGHAVFLEDGPEMLNEIRRNWVMKVRDPGSGWRIKIHDQNFGGTFSSAGPAGFWITNLNNRFTDNGAQDIEGIGIWNSLAANNFGLSASVTSVRPGMYPPLEWSNNTGSSSLIEGMRTDSPVTNEAGLTVTGSRRAIFTSNGTYTEDPFHALAVPGVFDTAKLWKNNRGGYLNNVSQPNYRFWTVSDNLGMGFSGTTSGGIVSISQGHLIVARSLNTGTLPANCRTPPNNGCFNADFAFSTYHGTLAFPDTTIVNYAPTGTPVLSNNSNGGQHGMQLYTDTGGIAVMDMYLTGADFTLADTSTNMKFINSSAGFQTPPGHIQDEPPYNSPVSFDVVTGIHWSLSGALKDTAGYWGQPNGWKIYDHLFLTHEAANLQDPIPAGVNNGKTTTSRYFAVKWAGTDSHPARRQITFTATPSGTSGTLSSPWTGPTRTDYPISFLTSGTNGYTVRQGATLTNGSTAVTWSSSISGVLSANAIITYQFLYDHESRFARLDSSWAEVAGAVWHAPTGIGASKFSNMRHSSMMADKRFDMSHPGLFPGPNTREAVVATGGMEQATDILLLQVPWSGSVVPKVYATTTTWDPVTYEPSAQDIIDNEAIQLTEITCAALDAAAGHTYCRDTANNKVRIKAKGGLVGSDTSSTYYVVSPL